MRVAIIGAGISGLTSAWLLHREHDITVFEAGDYIGGHTHTVDVDREKLFDATLVLAHQPITGPALAGILVRHPVMTLKAIAAIHWQALRLWLKRIPMCAHPPKRDSDYIKNAHKPTEGQP